MKGKCKKTAAVLLAALGLFVLFAACSRAQASGSGAVPEAGTSGPLEIRAMLVQYQQPPDPNGAFWKDMESRYNIKYTAEWVQDSAYSDKLALVLSTNDLPDIIQVTDTAANSVIKAIEAGQFKDLTPYLDWNKYPNLGKVSASAWTNSKYKGRNYVFPRSRGQYNDSAQIRGDILNKYNLAVPKTITELEAYFEAVKKEGGIPITSRINTQIGWFQPCFGPGNVKPQFTQDGTGIVPQFLCESYALTAEWLQGLYKKGLIAAEFGIMNDTQNENIMISGKSGLYFKNVWHRYRLNEEIKKNLPGAEIVPLFSLSGDGGKIVFYDKGFFGGIMVNAKFSEDKFLRLLEFFNHTSDPANYNYFMYGLEGRYWTLVDGFPQLTEEGKRDVNNSFYCPYVLATDMYGKVDSPLAPPAYNRETREIVKVVDPEAASLGYAPFWFFNIISSSAWANYWALNQSDFDSLVVEVISGKKTAADLRAYQQRLLNSPEVQAAMKEFKQSWDEFGLADWKPPVL
jgi:putative aldouronate transport system substrate-binding protein